MGRTQVLDCFRRFKEGRTSVESDPRSGRPSTSRNEEMVAKVRTIVRNNRRLTIREIADDCATFAWISSPKTTGKMAGWRLDPAPGQCARTLHILCSSFWPNTAPLSCSNRHTHQILYRDFFLFPRLKKVLKGHRFEATEDIKRNSTKTLLDIPKEEFAQCFQQWQQRWAKCVAVEGNSVEDN